MPLSAGHCSPTENRNSLCPLIVQAVRTPVSFEPSSLRISASGKKPSLRLALTAEQQRIGIPEFCLLRLRKYEVAREHRSNGCARVILVFQQFTTRSAVETAGQWNEHREGSPSYRHPESVALPLGHAWRMDMVWRLAPCPYNLKIGR